MSDSNSALAGRSAVVFAYHNVGARCLRVLIEHGVDVKLVLTHEDDPNETIWFESVAKIAAQHGIPFITPEDPNTPDLIERIRSLAPDFFFSFYYRRMLSPALLAIPPRGAFNMHGSLLPKYRGRVPINWAVINGETETGATLHYMTAKPDAGDIVGQQAVTIGPDETAAEVFRKVTSAAAAVLDCHLPALVAGTAPRIQQDLAAGGYFGGRKPADGRIDWSTATRVHNLVRGVAPPYPGAFTSLPGGTLKVYRTRIETTAPSAAAKPALQVRDGVCRAICADGSALQLLEMEFEGKPFTAQDFLSRFGDNPVSMETQQQ